MKLSRTTLVASLLVLLAGATPALAFSPAPLQSGSDCNGNGIPDDQETFDDCDGNGIPDECQGDCDGDGIPNECESDCDGDGHPDDCENDCDADGIPDDCESDLDDDHIPDDCDDDCDGDGIPNDLELDFDGDGMPDDCDDDCDDDGIPNSLERDGDGDGTPDDCENDCDDDGTPDDLELDFDGDGTPDDCDDDCDDDGIPNALEPDTDGDGNPDDCPGWFVFCSSTPNSTGSNGGIDGSGSVSIGDNDFTITTTNLPPNQPAIYFYGTEQRNVPFGNGIRCIGGHLTRYWKFIIDASGTHSITLDFTAPPFSSGPGQIVPGQAFYFQLWYRDPAAGGANYNTTDGLCVVFGP